jgi:hypothetical protein
LLKENPKGSNVRIMVWTWRYTMPQIKSPED